jgi:hypothetical protein
MPTEKLVRMVNPAGDVTEVNDSRLDHIVVPDAFGAVYVPQEVVADFMKTGFRVQELTQAELLSRVTDAIGELDDGPMRTALFAAITSTQLTTTGAVTSSDAAGISAS